MKEIKLSTWLLIVSVLGALSVALGAFGAHVIEDILDTNDYQTYNTAVRYQMWHTLAMLGVALLWKLFDVNLNTTLWLFVLGIIFFSGSLYILTLAQIPIMGAITPIGGVFMIAGWIKLGLDMKNIDN